MLWITLKEIPSAWAAKTYILYADHLREACATAPMIFCVDKTFSHCQSQGYSLAQCVHQDFIFFQKWISTSWKIKLQVLAAIVNRKRTQYDTVQSRWSKLGNNFPKNDFPEEIKNKFSFEHISVHVCWWSLTVSVRNLTLAMSTEPICSCELEGCWLVCQAEHCSDAEQCGWGSGWAITTAQHQASWYHLSVQWHSPLSHTCFKGIGFRVFAGFVSAHVWVRECGSMRDRACQPLIYSPEPWNMLQSAPKRARDLPLGIWHGKNSPKIKE